MKNSLSTKGTADTSMTVTTRSVASLATRRLLGDNAYIETRRHLEDNASIATSRLHLGGIWMQMRWVTFLVLFTTLMVSSEGRVVRVKLDEDVIFMCDTPDTFTKPHWIKWHKGHLDATRIDDRFTINHNTGSLTIQDVTIEDEGNYTCSAGWGQRFEPYTVSLRVLTAPDIKVTSPNPVSPHVMDKLTVSCLATGRPLPLILWYSSKQQHINSSVTEPGSRFSITEQQSGDTALESFLVISPVFAEDRGTFACKAANPVSTTKDNVVVDVQQKPVILSPRENILVYWWEGHKVNLTCQSVGNPAPVIKWTLFDKAGNARTGAISPMVDVTNGIFVSSHVWLSESGSVPLPTTYKCMAQNKYGVTSHRSFDVRKGVVAGTPVVKIVSIKDDEVILSIDIRVTQATPRVTYVSARYRLETGARFMETGTPFTGNGTTLLLRGIMLSNHYVIEVTAFNMVGESDKRIVTMFSEETTTPQQVTKMEGKRIFPGENGDDNDNDGPSMASDIENSTIVTDVGRALGSADGNNSASLNRCSLIFVVMFLRLVAS